VTALVVHVSFRVHPDDANEMKRVCSEMAAGTRAEPGCDLYEFSVDLEHHNCFLLRELWRDATALRSHFATDHMQRFRSNLRALRLEHRSARGYEIRSEFDPLNDVANANT